MKVSIVDVARKSGLSIVTVSRVINNSQSVREKNRQRVLQAMKELNYRPNAAARSLAKGRTWVIGLIVMTLHDTFLDQIVQEISALLEMQGYYLALSIAPAVNRESEHYLIEEDRVDGVILLSPINEDYYVHELKKKKIPFVLIDNQHQHPSSMSILIDNFKGGYEATRHLIELGHTRIAHLGGPDIFLSSQERKAGFLYALKEAGLAPYLVEQGNFEIGFGYETGSKWIRENTLPSAVFACDDYIAIGLINALGEAGIRVPRDVSVIGFDDQDIASQLRPLLTTIRQPAESVGRAAVDRLLESIGDSGRPGLTVKLEPKLIVRESTAEFKE